MSEERRVRVEPSTGDVLRKARKLIENPERWTQGANARNPYTGRAVNPFSARAGQFCARGAVIFAGLGSLRIYEAVLALRAAIAPHARTADPSEAIVAFNDTRSHAEVLAALDKAIAAAEATA